MVKRIFVCMSVLLLFLFSFSVAYGDACQENTNSVEGEWWYTDDLYTKRFFEATEDNEGALHVLDIIQPGLDNEQVFHQDGIIEYNGKKYIANYIKLTENACLYYFIQDNVFEGHLFIKAEDIWKYYSWSYTRKCLLYDQKMLSASKGKMADYFLKDNEMYFIKEDGYVRGDIEWYGDYVFICTLNTEPKVDDYGNGNIIDSGFPMYLFVSTNINEK